MEYKKTRILIQLLFLTLTVLGLFISLPIGWIIIFALLTGPICCGWMCPFGTLQDLLIRLRKTLGLPKLQLRGHRPLKWLRYLLFGITFINGGSLILQVLSYDPRVNFQQFLQIRSLNILNAIILVIFLLCALFIDRFFCKYLCVEGARQSIISGGRLFKIHRTPTCINCKKCDRACPMGITLTKSPIVNDLECISCMACIDACPVKGAIKIGPSLSWKRLLIALLLVCGLIAPLIKDLYEEKHGSSEEAEMVIVAPSPSEAISSDSVTLEIMPAHDETTTPPHASEEEQPTSIETTPAVDSSLSEILEGSAKGYKGTITVQVKKTGDHIDSITVLSHRDDRKWYNMAIVVLEEIVNSQSTDVDTVSGATYTSRGLINATKDALDLPPID